MRESIQLSKKKFVLKQRTAHQREAQFNMKEHSKLVGPMVLIRSPNRDLPISEHTTVKTRQLLLTKCHQKIWQMIRIHSSKHQWVTNSLRLERLWKRYRLFKICVAINILKVGIWRRTCTRNSQSNCWCNGNQTLSKNLKNKSWTLEIFTEKKHRWTHV